jgi:5,10-methylenetetrahydromethanopterin reductase
MNPSSWGLWLEPTSPVARLAELARHAEAHGASHVFVADDGTDRDLYVTMTAILLATERVVVGAGITNPFSRHPVTTAAAFATLDELAPGRVIVGLGVGGGRVLEPIGRTPARPLTALRETLDIVDRLLAGECVSRAGDVSTVDARIPWSRGRLPIAVAGRGPRVQAFAATTADWILLSGKPLDELAGAVATLRSRAAEVGRIVRVAWSAYLAWDAATVDAIRPHFTYATVDMPPETRVALGISEIELASVRETMARDGIEAAARYVPRSVVERAAVVGDPGAIVEGLREQLERVAPDLFLLPLHDHDVAEAFIATAARLLRSAGFTEAPDHAGVLVSTGGS